MEAGGSQAGVGYAGLGITVMVDELNRRGIQVLNCKDGNTSSPTITTATLSGGKMTFVAEHFSTYAFVAAIPRKVSVSAPSGGAITTDKAFKTQRTSLVGDVLSSI